MLLCSLRSFQRYCYAVGYRVDSGSAARMRKVSTKEKRDDDDDEDSDDYDGDDDNSDDSDKQQLFGVGIEYLVSVSDVV